MAGCVKSQRLRAALDQLQISIGERWRRYVQGTALWLSGAYGFSLAYLLNVSGRSVYVIDALVIGGFFSWGYSGICQAASVLAPLG